VVPLEGGERGGKALGAGTGEEEVRRDELGEQLLQLLSRRLSWKVRGQVTDEAVGTQRDIWPLFTPRPPTAEQQVLEVVGGEGSLALTTHTREE